MEGGIRDGFGCGLGVPVCWGETTRHDADEVPGRDGGRVLGAKLFGAKLRVGQVPSNSTGSKLALRITITRARAHSIGRTSVEI